MNTLKLIKGTALVIAIAFTVASCAKDSNDPDMKSPYQDAGKNNNVVGQILDHGITAGAAKGEIRFMQAIFENAGEITDSGTGEVKGMGKNVNLSFYTDMDDMIPSGSYSFASGEVKEAFVLGNGYVIFVVGGDQDGYLNSIVTGGSVEVSNDGGLYTFILNLTLENGDHLTGSVSGQMQYYDVYL